MEVNPNDDFGLAKYLSLRQGGEVTLVERSMQPRYMLKSSLLAASGLSTTPVYINVGCCQAIPYRERRHEAHCSSGDNHSSDSSATIDKELAATDRNYMINMVCSPPVVSKDNGLTYTIAVNPRRLPHTDQQSLTAAHIEVGIASQLFSILIQFPDNSITRAQHFLLQFICSTSQLLLHSCEIK